MHHWALVKTLAAQGAFLGIESIEKIHEVTFLCLVMDTYLYDVFKTGTFCSQE